MKKNVIVVGAGIIGASLAYHLAKGGASVRVLEALGASGGLATPNSWAWINASWGNPEPYVKLRMQAMTEWRALAAVNDHLAVNWCGGLMWDLPPDKLHEYAETQKSWGYGTRVVDGAEALRLEPSLVSPPDIAVHVADEGAIEPSAAVAGFMQAAKSHGTEFLTGVEVLGLVPTNGRVSGVRISDSILQADEIVIAAGAQTAALLCTIGIDLKMETPAGLLVHSEPAPKQLNGMVLAPELHVRQTSEGRLVAGSDFGGTQPGDDPAATAAVLFSKVQKLLRGAENLKMEFYTTGYRPTPADGWPAMGRPSQMEGLYVAVMHSGITLAPAMGLFGADEILNGLRNPLLAPYHPDRLISA
jgi:glycine/D-amino acid oxidase-like deaminating enzyme